MTVREAGARAIRRIALVGALVVAALSVGVAREAAWSSGVPLSDVVAGRAFEKRVDAIVSESKADVGVTLIDVGSGRVWGLVG